MNTIPLSGGSNPPPHAAGGALSKRNSAVVAAFLKSLCQTSKVFALYKANHPWPSGPWERRSKASTTC